MTKPTIPTVVDAIAGVKFSEIILTLYISQFSILKLVALKLYVAYMNLTCPFELSSFSNYLILKRILLKSGRFKLIASFLSFPYLSFCFLILASISSNFSFSLIFYLHLIHIYSFYIFYYNCFEYFFCQ